MKIQPIPSSAPSEAMIQSSTDALFWMNFFLHQWSAPAHVTETIEIQPHEASPEPSQPWGFRKHFFHSWDFFNQSDEDYQAHPQHDTFQNPFIEHPLDELIHWAWDHYDKYPYLWQGLWNALETFQQDMDPISFEPNRSITPSQGLFFWLMQRPLIRSIKKDSTLSDGAAQWMDDWLGPRLDASSWPVWIWCELMDALAYQNHWHESLERLAIQCIEHEGWKDETSGFSSLNTLHAPFLFFHRECCQSLMKSWVEYAGVQFKHPSHIDSEPLFSLMVEAILPCQQWVYPWMTSRIDQLDLLEKIPQFHAERETLLSSTFQSFSRINDLTENIELKSIKEKERIDFLLEHQTPWIEACIQKYAPQDIWIKNHQLTHYWKYLMACSIGHQTHLSWIETVAQTQSILPEMLLEDDANDSWALMLQRGDGHSLSLLAPSWRPTTTCRHQEIMTTLLYSNHAGWSWLDPRSIDDYLLHQNFNPLINFLIMTDFQKKSSWLLEMMDKTLSIQGMDHPQWKTWLNDPRLESFFNPRPHPMNALSWIQKRDKKIQDDIQHFQNRLSSRHELQALNQTLQSKASPPPQPSGHSEAPLSPRIRL